MTNKVFISIKENFELVSKLIKDLETNGIEVFWDKKDIKPGHFWEDEIKKGINTGSFFIACFSKEFHEKKESYMHHELSIAIDRILRINQTVWFIPVILNETTLPERRIDNTFFESMHKDSNFAKMVEQIKEHHNKSLQEISKDELLKKLQKKEVFIEKQHKELQEKENYIEKLHKKLQEKKDFIEELFNKLNKG